MSSVAFTCPSCGKAAAGNFCAACGERRLGSEDRALRRYLNAVADFLTHFDTKGYRALWLLLTRPGLLSVEQLRGSRVNYPKPLALFVSLNIVYYLSISLLGVNTFSTPLAVQLEQNNYYASFAAHQVEARRQSTGLAPAVFEARFNEKASVYSRTLVFLFIPLYALIFWAFFFRRRRYFVEHAVVACHLWCFVLLLLTVAVPAIAFAEMAWTQLPSAAAALAAIDGPISAFLQVCVGVYLVLMLRRVYGVGLLHAVAVASVIAWSFFHLVWLYRFVLFLVALYSV